jgi:hypothetical protein
MHRGPVVIAALACVGLGVLAGEGLIATLMWWKRWQWRPEPIAWIWVLLWFFFMVGCGRLAAEFHGFVFEKVSEVSWCLSQAILSQRFVDLDWWKP